MSVPSSDTYTFDSSIRGYHVYRDRLVAAMGKTLISRKERGNNRDVYAVAVVEGDVIVGHVPRVISAVCYLSGGTNSLKGPSGLGRGDSRLKYVSRAIVPGT